MVEAAWGLFRDRGYDQTTVDEIAAAADVSPRTFFRYFATKEDVLFARLDEALAGLEVWLRARPASEPIWTALREAATAYAQAYDQDLVAARMIDEIVPSSPALMARFLQSFATIEAIATQWAAARLAHSETDIRPRVIGATATAAARVAFEQWLSGTGSSALADHLRAALDVFTPLDEAGS
jgi:AcrR family transcriptional regulator